MSHTRPTCCNYNNSDMLLTKQYDFLHNFLVKLLAKLSLRFKIVFLDQGTINQEDHLKEKVLEIRVKAI